MKIIREGVNPKNREYQFTCYHCETIFTCYRHECKETEDRDGSYLSFNCPICNSHCSVKASNYIKPPPYRDDWDGPNR